VQQQHRHAADQAVQLLHVVATAALLGMRLLLHLRLRLRRLILRMLPVLL
jgi:hypothetical protein